MVLEIRHPVLADIDGILDKRKKFILEVTGKEMPEKAISNTLDYLKKNIKTDKFLCLLAIDKEEIAALIFLCIYDVIPKPYNITGKIGYIYNVYTLKEYRGQGLAEALLKRTIEEARQKGINEIYLNAEEVAIPLYKNHGFKFVDREMVLKL